MSSKDSKPSRVTNVQVPGGEQQPAGAGAADTSTSGATSSGDSKDPEDNLDAMRARIRAEERDNARRELGAQIQAAASVVGDAAAPAAGPARSKADYRNMHAHEIDPSTLTAPVLTKDGYLCPPAPEAKK